MKRNPRLGSAAANRMIAAMDNNVDPQPISRAKRNYDYDYEFREATNEEYDKIADEYERRIYGD